MERTAMEYSDDAIVIGDPDDWENMMVVSGTATRVLYWKATYTLVNVRTGGSVRTVDRVTITLTPPAAGTRTTEVTPPIKVEGEGFTVAGRYWLYGPTVYTSDEPDFVFEEGQTYYLEAMLKADEGTTFFKDGEPGTGNNEGFIGFGGCQVNGGELVYAGSRTLNDGHEWLRVKLSVTAGPADSGTPLSGDVDGSGKVDSTDARLVLQLSVGKIAESDLSVPAAADADGSRSITSTDARLILQFAVGKIKAFPV